MKRRKAPGLSGIPGEAWRIAMEDETFRGKYRELISKCLRENEIPDNWRVAKLVLIQKPGKKEEDRTAYRPICLLEEDCKIFERIVVERMKKEMKGGNTELDERQYGFREERSTNNAIERLEKTVKRMVEKEGMACVVTIDITNAFNSVPWNWIRTGIKDHGISNGLEQLVMNYFKDRYVEFGNNEGKRIRKKLERGVPQGSVLGPTLWNLAYDRTIGTPVPTSTEIVCYADDTVIVTGGNNQEEVLGKANLAIGCVTKRIREMGMKVSPSKSEMMLFAEEEEYIKEDKARVMMENVWIRKGKTIKYLGLNIDRRWEYDIHMERIGEKMERAADEMSRLLPNISGPGEGARRLYANVVHSIGMYGAPNWWKKIEGSKNKNKEGIKRIYAAQKRMALRITRAYRTTARDAVTLMAGIPPFAALAEKQARVYEATEVLKEKGIKGKDRKKALTFIKKEEEKRMREKWKEELMNKEGPEGIRVREAIVPVMEEWLDRRGKGLTYHMSQIITGHGCFRKFLKRIGKEKESTCIYCQCQEDDAQHTLEGCAEWIYEREELERSLGTTNLSLGNVIINILQEQDKWDAFQNFCGNVMKKKERDERLRRGEEDEDSEDTDTIDGKDRKGKRGGRDRNELEKWRQKLRKIKKRKKRRWKTPAHLRK